MMRRLIQTVVLVSALVVAAGVQAVPAQIPYSGYLTGEEGLGYDGTVKVEAALYAQAEGGQAAWGPCTYAGVDVVEGYLCFLVGKKGTGLGCQELATEDLLPEGMYLEVALDDVLLSPRQWLGSVAYALQADDAQRLAGKSADQYVTGAALDGYVAKNELAGVALTGKYSDLSGSPDLAGYALTSDLKPVCFSGSYADLVQVPDLAGFVTLADLATVAATGSYLDLSDPPDLGLYAQIAELAAVATSGLYGDLADTPDLSVYLKQDGSVGLGGDWDVGKHRLLNMAVDASVQAPAAPVAGQVWWDAPGKLLRVWTGTEWLGLGSGAGALPMDGLAAVSNGTLTNELEKEYAASGLPVGIGVSKDVMVVVVEQGTLVDLAVTVSLEHPGADELEVRLLSPDDPAGLLLVKKGQLSGNTYTKEFTVQDGLPDGGSLQSLVGKEQGGTWILRVTDTKQNGNEGAGKVKEFKLATTYLASAQVAVNADVAVSGTLSADTLSADGLEACGSDACARLAAYDAKFLALEADLWCLRNCDEWKLSDCQKRTCDGVGKKCTAAGAQPDGTSCQLGKGKCQEGQCCVPNTCGALNAQCGEISDGCGGTLDCGVCQGGAVCVDNACCLAETCETLGKECGSWEDGCGGMTGECGPCMNGHDCGGSGLCDGPWVGIDCGGIACPELAGYDVTCNGKEHCEYANVDLSGWKEWDVWIWVAPGTFQMGSEGEGGGSDETPVHPVTISKGYFIGKYEIVVAQYEACKAANPGKCTPADTTDWPGTQGTNTSGGGKGEHPQNGLTWQQAKDFCGWVAPSGRLPSEAEWEYAATGPVHLKYPWGNSPDPTCSNNTAVFNEAGGAPGYGCSQGGTWKAGSKTAGAAWSGALDMSGNLWEWNEDWYHNSYSGAPADGSAWVDPTGSARVIRGGGFNDGAVHMRSAERYYHTPGDRDAYLGGRCLRP